MGRAKAQRVKSGASFSGIRVDSQRQAAPGDMGQRACAKFLARLFLDDSKSTRDEGMWRSKEKRGTLAAAAQRERCSAAVGSGWRVCPNPSP